MFDFSGYKLVAALGNPGEEYAGTYHNAGFIALERLTEGADLRYKEMDGRYAYAKAGGTVFVKPLTYMNESGGPIRAAADYFRISPAEILVIHDDSDLPLGDCKLQFGRGAAGHHGIESIIRAFGTQDFHRLRVGIRHRPGKAGNFVLTPMSRADRETIYGALEGCQTKESEKLKPEDSFLT